MTTRSLYQPHDGHTVWGSLALPQRGQVLRAGASSFHAEARVLREDGTPVENLYAIGNDMQSIMGGVYPGPGITIGPGIVFGYVAATHAARKVPPGSGRIAPPAPRPASQDTA